MSPSLLRERVDQHRESIPDFDTQAAWTAYAGHTLNDYLHGEYKLDENKVACLMERTIINFERRLRDPWFVADIVANPPRLYAGLEQLQKPHTSPQGSTGGAP